MPDNKLNDLLRHHVTGAIERGEAEPIVGIPEWTASEMFSVGRFPLAKVIAITEGSAVVAHVNGAFGEQTAKEWARRITAAPDMLAALRKAEDRLGVLIECDQEDHGTASVDDVAAWELVRAAIAKAEGR